MKFSQRKDCFVFNTLRRVGLTGIHKVLLGQASIEQIRIISLVCHLFGCKEEGGILSSCLLNSLIILILVISSGQNTSLKGLRAGFWSILPDFFHLQNLRPSRNIKLCSAGRQYEAIRCRTGGAHWLPSTRLKRFHHLQSVSWFIIVQERRRHPAISVPVS